MAPSTNTHTPTERETERGEIFYLLDMLLFAVSALVVAQPSSEVTEGLMNYSIYSKGGFGGCSSESNFGNIRFFIQVKRTVATQHTA
jgi:hypothetical protein